MKVSDLPRISIITPSYNQGYFIEETICSVLNQNYPNLEYIIIDGGSSDNTVEVIKKYEKYLTYWVSESDRGQTHAINKGLALITGDIWSYLNSDDLLCPGSLQRIAEVFHDPQVNWVGGVSSIIQDNQDRVIGYIEPKNPSNIIDYLLPWSRNIQYLFPCSNVCFMRKEILEKCGFFDETYNYGMDIEYYIRSIFIGNFFPYFITDILGKWRWHSESKTMKLGLAFGFRSDEIKMANQYKEYLDLPNKQKLELEILVQEKWIVLRKAGFYKQEGYRNKAFIYLFKNLKTYPSLIWFRPWISAIGKLILGL
ncbi:glycosyl transferase [Synechococcus sp. PCC 7502]|uniref:glycosyltransferase family 2 protein n=1 Tax=Synechococcus sp. PCC 7502 TaxID=1173263 RepID=UPI00029FA882|nr:glycosyltransferase family 2 protein [Synechococcus sp. PCC 7502]AFY74973.1 glycosyl transferase [Synechococcus sp. PCC 7502]